MNPRRAVSRGTLLAVFEVGGYPDFAPLYERAGYEVLSVISVRKALGVLKKLSPAVIVAEFNYQSDFRDRTSTLESLLAVVQTMPDTRVILFYESEYAHQLARLEARFPIFAAFPYPIQVQRLEESLCKASGNHRLVG
jgi:hypothetical protein